MSEPFEDSRRLTGANLYFDAAGAALEIAPGVTFDAGTLQCWRGNIARVRAALDWPDGAVFVREHASGASLAFAAPLDQLYTATEANEWALYAALGLRADDTPVDEDDEHPRPHVAHFDDDEALRQLRALAEAEAKPRLIALLEAAHAHGVPAHADDEVLSLGEGEAAQSWPLEALPWIDAVPWPRLRGVPKAVVTGSNGKTTTVRLLAAMLRAHGLACGYSSTDGLFIDGERIEAGDYSGPVGARTVLRHPRVQAAVLETARGGLLRRGLVADDARTAIVTNVSVDHFGEYGVHALDDLAAVKLVVAKSLAAGGMLVLNADDAMLVKHAAATHAPRFGWFAALGFAICCALRLARFNAQIDTEDQPHKSAGFLTGVPAPVGAGLAFLPMFLWLASGNDWFREPVLVAGWTALIAFLMISNLATMSWKSIRPGKDLRLGVIALGGLIFAALLTEPWWTLVMICAVYLALMPLGIARYARVRRLREQAAK